MDTLLIQAKVLWFNEAKGYGLVRAVDRLMDDIRVDANIVENQQHLLLEVTLIEASVKETLAGLMADSIRFLDNPPIEENGS
jgi:hypothetical protein